MRTIVIVAVGTGVFVIVAVAVGGRVAVGVALGAGVSVGGKRPFCTAVQACNKTDDNNKTIRYLRIDDLFHAIIL